MRTGRRIDVELRLARRPRLLQNSRGKWTFVQVTHGADDRRLSIKGRRT
jgi:hypothetical protein